MKDSKNKKRKNGGIRTRNKFISPEIAKRANKEARPIAADIGIESSR